VTTPALLELYTKYQVQSDWGREASPYVLLQFVILATDGLWDFLSNIEAAQIVCECMRAGNQADAAEKLIEATLYKAAEANNLTLDVRIP
jgi:serine/threonine protein phosphatase PrpC